MHPSVLGHAHLAIDLNQPGTYLRWSFIDISLANLIVIVVMMVIFGAALLIRFPHASSGVLPPEEVGTSPAATAASAQPGDEGMWTAKARTKLAKSLPPKKLLPDRQPAYVASWVYVFGIATLVALAIVVVSGFALAFGGPDWWHTNPVGHFFNSIHLWSVELFMAFMVIHLWGKFWMAAWRGRRAMTWITGVIAFMASVVTAFTGYLSQQNFDSQWIATNGKDAFNAVGVGAFWNVMNFGQMLMWHIVLMPLILLAIVGGHVLLVRVRGVSHPLPEHRARQRGRAARKAATADDAAPWRGPTRRYDILKEGTIATLIVSVIVLLMAGILSSPDDPSVTVQRWSTADAQGFVGTAAMELDGTAGAADYGPPYNNGTSSVQQVGPVNFQKLFGVTQPLQAAQAFVLAPLSKLAPTTPVLAGALAQYNGATPAQQQKWASAYDAAVTKAKRLPASGLLPVPGAGPVPVMMAYELKTAQSGALDASLLAQHPFYGTDYTKPLLFVADGDYYKNLATSLHLTGDQWGVMNETGSYPGQPWLWLYQLWYHVPPFSNSASVDIWAVFLTGICTILLLLIPFIPGLRDVPRVIPVYRLIWRPWYRMAATAGAGVPAAESAALQDSNPKA
ncbi:MAG TPA: cytochrome b N-terminal domain-containing protein [Streptosporangiaceae bacterium]|nr:cytochrome b N-terminal domain-containing protein [Streptosporangiaceae bacterium]